VTKQTNGWQARAINNARQARQARNALIAKLRRERVGGDEHTPAELVAIHAQLKEDVRLRHPEWFR
jgi:hypothetical protein